MRKKVLIIDTLYFENTEELADSILEQYEKFEEGSDDFCGVSVIAHYQIIVDLINYLVKNTSFEIANVQIEEGEMDNYYDEWVMNIDTSGKLWCEPALRPKNEYNDGGYVICEEDAIFVHGDVNSKFIGMNKEQNLIAFEIGEDEDSCDGDCENCDCKDLDTDSSEYTHISREKDGKIAGFTKSWSDTKNGISYYSSYSHYSTDEDALRKVAEDFGIRL